MASFPDKSDEYIPSDSDDDDDHDDDDDDDERPNRWHGPPTTWQQMNSEEIDTLTALNEIRNKNLSVHLYNAFALKHRHHNHPRNENLPIPDKDINAATGQPVREDDWVPQRSWTAWPMSADNVPPPEFMRRTDEAGEKDTTKKAVVEWPSTALEEAISATILRIAKEKFNSRPWQEDDPDEESVEEGVSDADSIATDDSENRPDSSRPKSRSMSRPIKQESDTEGESSGQHMEAQGSEENERPPKEGYLRPTVSTDDDLAYALLRPSARHILSKLEATLQILHIFQDSTMHYMSDTADSDVSASSRASRQTSRERSQPRTKIRGRPRKDSTRYASRGSEPPADIGNSQSRKAIRIPVTNVSAQPSGLDENESKKKTNRGRPKKIYERLQDESDREYAIRVARLQKRPIPTFADPDSGAEAGRESDEENETKIQRTKRKATKELSPERSRPRRTPKDWWKRRINLRDWRNVIGAAALAGFPPGAIDRAARRCADLFGQSMELHTLPGGPFGQTSGVKTTRYVPGMPRPPLLESEDEEEPRVRNRRGTREPSMAADATSGGEHGFPRGNTRSGSYNSRRSRSRSASAAGTHFCTFSDCPRTTEGFSRRQNLLRHLKLVHGYEGDTVPVEVDSEDEMYGGVHVDGFLKPIKIRRGWRANDVEDEPRKRKRGRPLKGSVSGKDERRRLGRSSREVDVDGEFEEW